MASVEGTVITVSCPECGEHIDVPITPSVKENALHLDPDVSALWDHAWSHLALPNVMDLDGDQHIIDLREDGWAVRHPLACRGKASLLDCPFTTAATAWAAIVTNPPRTGRYPVTLSQSGGLLIDWEAEL